MCSAGDEANEAIGALVARAQAGDSDANSMLLSLYRPLVAAAVARLRRALSGGAVSQEDLWQEGCRNLLELVQEYRGGEPRWLGRYLKLMLGFRLANYLRAEYRRRRFDHVLDEASMEQLVDGAQVGRVGGLTNPRLRSALKRLLPKQRAVLYKLHWQGRPVAEVAAELGLSKQAITALRRRAELRLRREMVKRSSEPCQE